MGTLLTFEGLRNHQGPGHYNDYLRFMSIRVVAAVGGNSLMVHRCYGMALLAMAANCLVLADCRTECHSFLHDDVAPEIRDDANFFSPAAVQKADQRIREIYRRHDRDVLIETFPTVPAADSDKVKAMDEKQRNAYFLGWAKSRFKERVVNGAYILICKEPLQFEVGVEEARAPQVRQGYPRRRLQCAPPAVQGRQV